MNNDQTGQNSAVAGDVEGRALSFWDKATYSVGEMGVSLSPAIVVGWLIYFYTGREIPGGGTMLLVSAWGIAILGLLGRVVDSLADPLVGFFSDKWNFKWGRRIPWVVVGTPFLALFQILIWFPPEPSGIGTVWYEMSFDLYFVQPFLQITPNFVWVAVMASGFWFFYTVVVAPYLSLLPEITPYNKERIQVSEAMAYMDVVAMLVGALAVGMLIQKFGGGLDLGFYKFDNGYQVAGLLLAFMFSVGFYVSVIKVRERPFDDAKAVPFNFVRAMKESFSNPPFVPYVISVSFLRLAIDVFIAFIPFMVVNIMGLGEGLAGALQGVIVLASALMFWYVTKLSARIGKKKVLLIGLLGMGITFCLLAFFEHFPFLGYVISGPLSLFGVTLEPGMVSFLHCVVLLLVCAFPVATIMVLPRAVLCDVMDEDEQRTGYRREAMYNGMEGLITKAAAGIAAFIVPLLNKYLGATKLEPWGVLSGIILAGGFSIAGWVALKFYSIEK